MNSQLTEKATKKNPFSNYIICVRPDVFIYFNQNNKLRDWT